VKRFKGNDKIGHGITAVAKLLDMSPDVLQKRLSPACETHAITLDQAEEISQLIGDPAAAIEFSRVMGMACIPMPRACEAGQLYRGASEVAKEFSEFFDAFQEATRDNAISPNEVQRLQAEFAQADDRRQRPDRADAHHVDHSRTGHQHQPRRSFLITAPLRTSRTLLAPCLHRHSIPVPLVLTGKDAASLCAGEVKDGRVHGSLLAFCVTGAIRRLLPLDFRGRK
jgi:hypothetical protein